MVLFIAPRFTPRFLSPNTSFSSVRRYIWTTPICSRTSRHSNQQKEQKAKVPILEMGKTIKLPDNREMGFHEFGDPNGTPVIYIHGTPDSGVALTGIGDRVGKKMGVRWIAPDRPGIGSSTIQHGRRVTDYPSDLLHLLRHLELERYHIFGTSGGTGYTLACAKDLPRSNLKSVGICAGVGPSEAGLEGQSELHQAAMKVWKETPEIILEILEASYVAMVKAGDRSKVETQWRKEIELYFEGEDQQMLLTEDSIQSAVSVFCQVYAHGVAGHAEDNRINMHPWNLRLEDVNFPGIWLWYGSKDVNTPPQMGKHMANRLPHSRYKEYGGKTHITIWSEPLLEEFLTDLLTLE